MKVKEFFDLQHAHSYLVGTIIRLKDEPIYITQVNPTNDGSWTYRYNKLGSTKHEYVEKESKNINMEPVPLGMAVINKEAIKKGFFGTFMVSRIPARIWKVGLSWDNMHIVGIDKADKTSGLRDLFFRSSEMRSTILGEYPTVLEAMKSTDETGASFAISRSFAIRGRNLYYKDLGRSVGKVLPSGKLDLIDKYSYLLQQMNEEIK